MPNEAQGRKFYVQQALLAARRIRGLDDDLMHLGVVQGALEHVLERWDEWQEEEAAQLAAKGEDDGKTDVGAGCGKACGEVRGYGSGWCGSDVQAGHNGQHAGSQDPQGEGGSSPALSFADGYSRWISRGLKLAGLVASMSVEVWCA